MPTNAEDEFRRRYGISVGDAFEDLYPYARYLTVDDRDEAKELLGEFFTRQLGRLARATTVQYPSAYLRKALLHTYIDLLRRRRPRDEWESLDAAVPESPGTAVAGPSSTFESWDWLVSVLGPTLAELLWRHVVDGVSQAELARRDGDPPSTVGDRIRGALQRLRRNLEEGT